MKTLPRILLLAAAAWTWDACGLRAQESTGSGSPARSSSVTSKITTDSLEGIATGYRGHYACRLFSGTARELAIAVSDVEPERVAQLLVSGADVNARSDALPAPGMTLLQVAVMYEWGEESIVLLIEAGANVNARDQRGDTALTIACRNPAGSNLPVVARLIRAGAAVNAKGAKGMTPLMCAALCDRTGLVVKTLMEASADVAARDDLGWTALMHATRRRRELLAVVQMLVKAGADVNAAHKYGGTALSNAAYNGHTQTVRFLIRAGADVNSSDSAKLTPLICSSMNGHLQIVQLLIESGAKVNDADSLGRTALDVARINRQNLVEKLLMRVGAKE